MAEAGVGIDADAAKPIIKKAESARRAMRLVPCWGIAARA
jgi:hypothetical protein